MQTALCKFLYIIFMLCPFFGEVWVWVFVISNDDDVCGLPFYRAASAKQSSSVYMQHFRGRRGRPESESVIGLHVSVL